MRVRTGTLAVLMAIVLPATLALTQVEFPLRLQPMSKLTVAGTSTVRSWECRAKAFDAQVDASTGDAAAAVVRGEKTIGDVSLTVPAQQLDCGNGTMNGHMLKALKGGEFPTIAYKVQSYDLVKGADAARVTLTGVLTLAGVQKTITMDATARAVDGGLLVSGAYDLRMTDYGLKPPTLMLGTLKVGDEVKVQFQLLLKP